MHISYCCLQLLQACKYPGSDIPVQPRDPLVVTDTTYFKQGEDDWNLVESVLRGEPGSVLLLLKRGANPDASAEGGMTALMFAAELGDTIVAKILVLNGAQTELTRVENTTPLLVAVLNQHFSIALLLLQKGANPDHRDNFKGTPLLYASAMNDYRMADLLLFFGASDTLKDGDGNDAMMTAVHFGNLETADVLLQNGLSPDSRDKQGNTPLMIAAQQGNEEMVSLLLEYGAEKESVNGQNYTPLTHAVRSGQEKAARILADSGANVHHQVTGKQNLYDMAASEPFPKIQKILKEKGARPTPRPDFSMVGLAWGNSFGSNEHMMQFRIWLQDRKFGFFIETGYDVRPVTRTIQVELNDTLIHQYREKRSAWTHGIGKYFTLYRSAAGMEYGCYAALYGMLSVPKYRGIAEKSPAEYNLIPSAGLFLSSRFAGMKTGIERYTFGTLYEGSWKMNITLYIRIRHPGSTYETKEISY